MKSKFAKLAILAGVISSVSCAAGPNAQTGAVLGGLGGAAVGGIIGHQSGRGLEGAAIGGALGAVGGGVVGNAQDQRNQQRYQQQQYYQQQQQQQYYQPQPRPYYGY